MSDDFAAIRGALENIGCWREEFVPFVDELIELRELKASILAEYKANPWAVGSRGQAVENPHLKQYIALQVRTMALSEALLLSPRSRARAGVKEPESDPLEDLFNQ